MIANMITLVSKHPEVVKVVVITITVFMVTNMALLKIKYLGNLLSGYAHTLSPRKIWTIAVARFQESIVTALRAEVMELAPYPALVSLYLFGAYSTGYRQEALAGINASSSKHLIYGLA